MKKALFISVGILASMVGGFLMVIFFGGSSYNFKNVSQQSPSLSAISQVCRAKQLEASKAETPIQQQIAVVLQKMNDLGQKLSQYNTIGETTSDDVLAKRSGNFYYVQEVQDLDSQYSKLQDQLTAIQSKFTC